MEQLKKIGWERLAIWFLYISAQFLVLTSLLLTTTSILSHAIFMVLSLTFYFLTAFKEVTLELLSQGLLWGSKSQTMKTRR